MEDVLILTGFMGAGKTSTGRELARLLGWEFVDLDEEIEVGEGKSISAIFAEHGEDHFRGLEAAALERALERTRVVIGTGGGVLLLEKNRRLLQGKSVVYLHASPGECLRRLRKSRNLRPLLAGPDPERRALAIYEEREPLYASLGRKVDTEGLSPKEVAAAIAEGVRGMEGAALRESP